MGPVWMKNNFAELEKRLWF